jgi:SMODS and SLOG-associating 2TM effector domain family 4
MAVDDPNPPPGSAPASTQEQEAPARQGSAPLVDIEKDAVSPELGGQGSRVWSKSERQLLTDWIARITAAQHAHYYLMTQLRRRNLMLGIPVIALTAAVGTALFSSIANGDSAAPVWAKITAGVVSALAGVLAAIQTFMKFSERAEKHAVAADWMAAIRRDMEVVVATPEATRGDPTAVLAKLRKEINRIAQSAPAIGEPVWHRFAKQYGVKEPQRA